MALYKDLLFGYVILVVCTEDNLHRTIYKLHSMINEQNTGVYPKVSGLGHNEIKKQQ
jgi:hypothetical protein